MVVGYRAYHQRLHRHLRNHQCVDGNNDSSKNVLQMKTVRCFNNTGLEDFLVLDREYKIISEDALYYYTEDPADSAFFKTRFHGDTQECLANLEKGLDEEGITGEEKATRIQDVKDIIAKTEESSVKMREIKKMGFAGFIQRIMEAANKQRGAKQ